MKLKIYNRQNTSAIRTGQNTVSISMTGGIFTFSKTASRKLKLNPGDKVVFGQQENNIRNWFFALASKSDSDAFELSDNEGCLLFRCAGLARNVLTSFKENKSIRLFISDDVNEVDGLSFYQLIPVLKSDKKK